MLDAGGGGGGGMAAMAQSMVMLKQAGADGSFTVNETGGQALLVAIREMAKWIDTNVADLDILAQQPPLGTSYGADAMKPYVQQVATDNEGFLTMLREFRTTLTDAEQGVMNAMANYQSTDTDAGANFRA
jgi:hypothetical protein